MKITIKADLNKSFNHVLHLTFSRAEIGAGKGQVSLDVERYVKNDLKY